MPTNRTRRKRARAGGATYLSDADRQVLDLGFTLDGFTSALEGDPKLAEEHYWRHRDELLSRSAEPGLAGWRPWSFWQFEARTKPAPWSELKWLRDHDKLRPDELGALAEPEQGLRGPFDDPSELNT